MKTYPLKIGNTEYTVGGSGDMLETPPSARGFSLKVFECGTGEYATVFKATEENGYAFLIYADSTNKLILRGGQGSDHNETVYAKSKELQIIRKEKYADQDNMTFMRKTCLSGRAWIATLQNKKYYFIGIWNASITPDQYSALKEYFAIFPKDATYVQMGMLGSEASSKFTLMGSFSPKLVSKKDSGLTNKEKKFVQTAHVKMSQLPAGYAKKLQMLRNLRENQTLATALRLQLEWSRLSTGGLNELDYEGAIGFHEMSVFYQKATSEQEKQMETCLENGNFECVRNLITQVTGMTTQHLRENDLVEGWKDWVAAGALAMQTMKNPSHAAAANALNPASYTVPQTISRSINTSGDSLLRKKTSDYIGHWEGKKNRVYKDSSGLPTVGIGHYLTDTKQDRQLFAVLFGKSVDYDDVLSGKQSLTDEQIEKLFNVDVKIKEKLASNKIDNFSSLPMYVKNAVINALYRGDLGPKTIKLINTGNWGAAAKEYLNHQNARSGPEQIQRRMKTNALAFAQFAKNQSEFFGFNYAIG